MKSQENAASGLNGPVQGASWLNPRRWLNRALTIVSPTAISLFASLLAFYPKIGIQPGSPLDPIEMFSSPFAVTYDAPIPIKTVSFSCILEDVVTEPHIVFQGLKSRIDRTTLDWMFWGDTETVYCGFPMPPLGMFGPNAVRATIYIAVDYYPLGVPFLHRWKLSKFESARQSDGGFRWLSKSPLWGWGRPPSTESLATFVVPPTQSDAWQK